MNKPVILKVILLLALIQAVAALVRPTGWVHIGADLFGQGLLLLPFVGAMAILRGAFIALIALLYVVFVIGGSRGRSWAWWFCCAASTINVLLGLAALARRVPVGEVILWSVIPVILLFYIFSGTGRAELKFA